MDHAAVMNSCDAKAHCIGLGKLTAAERIVTLLSQANFEIECGGMSQYFYNSAGEHAREAITALKEVGAMQAASAMETALALFPEGITTTGTDERFCELLNQFSEELDSLNSLYYSENPDVFSRLCIYIENHAVELKKHIK